MLDYKVNDIVTSKDNNSKALGICTKIEGALIYVNYGCRGGAAYFEKYKGEVEKDQFKDQIEEQLRLNEWYKTHDLHKDSVTISITSLIEIQRAFQCLRENKESYLHKVFGDDYVFDALSELNKTYKEYFEIDKYWLDD